MSFIAGVTLMALGAMAKYEGLDVKIVPCGKFSIHVCACVLYKLKKTNANYAQGLTIFMHIVSDLVQSLNLAIPSQYQLNSFENSNRVEQQREKLALVYWIVYIMH